MNVTTAIQPGSIARIEHREAMRITARENRKVGDALRSLAPQDWQRRTDCPRWDVRQLAAHMVGSATAQASALEFARQVRVGKPIVAEIGAQYWWDGVNELHVRERESATARELVVDWDRHSARALTARRRLPRPVAALPVLRLPDPVGRVPLSYLFDMGFTRDAWMHRVDVDSAVGRPVDVDAEHDGRIIADLVAEWSTTHDDAFSLVLTGPAGGTYRRGDGGEEVVIDAVDFARTLAGRLPGAGVMRHPLPL